MEKQNISEKIFEIILDLIQNQSVDQKDIMVIFRKRNKNISELIKLLKNSAGLKIYSKEYISFDKDDELMKKFFIIIQFFLDYKDEYKSELLIQNNIFRNYEKIEKMKWIFLNFGFKDFLDQILFLSMKKEIILDENFIKYIIKVYNSYIEIQPTEKQDEIFNFLKFLKQNSHEIIESSESSWGGDCVRILTIHSSKGLESDYVIFFDDFSDFSENEKKDSYCFLDDQFIFYHFKDPYFDEKIYDQKIEKIFEETKKYENLTKNQSSEEKRLLYVALTRARKRLIIVPENKKIFEKYEKIQKSLNSDL